MMLLAHIFREGSGWSAHCDAIGVYTQGRTRREAAANLAEAIELQANRRGMRITVTDLEDEVVFVSANEPGLLAAEVLRHQRETHKLSLADVAKRLGASSTNAYAAYEQGKREPSLSKFRELLAVVAPEMRLGVWTDASVPATRKAKQAR